MVWLMDSEEGKGIRLRLFRLFWDESGVKGFADLYDTINIVNRFLQRMEKKCHED